MSNLTIKTGYMAEVEIPSLNDWTDEGVAVEASAGQWDQRINGGCGGACTCVKVGDIFHLYYIGADGDRGDSGPANRKLGVATSSNGTDFTKYGSNPVLTHAVGVSNCDECGIFGAAARMMGGEVILYFTGMEEATPGSVDGDIRLARSPDGFTFSDEGDVLVNGTARGDDECHVLGAIRIGDNWSLYYSAKGSDVTNWSLTLASLTGIDTYSSSEDVANVGLGIGMGDPVMLSPTKICLPILTSFGGGEIQWYTTTAGSLNSLTLQTSYTISNVRRATIYLDRESHKWFMWFIDSTNETDMRVMTAPMRYV